MRGTNERKEQLDGNKNMSKFVKCKSKANNEGEKKIQPTQTHTGTHITKMITLGFFLCKISKPNAREEQNRQRKEKKSYKRRMTK